MTFDTLTRENAKAFFDLYMSRKDKVLAEFMARSETTGGPKASELDYSKESLIPLWLWVRDKTPFAEQHPSLELLPPWYSYELVTNPYSRTICFTPEASANLDGLSYYFGEVVLRNVPDAKWGIDPYLKEFHFCKPVVRSEFFTCYPIGSNITGACIYNKSPLDFRVAADSLASEIDTCIKDEARYRELYYAKGGKHDDPRVKKKIEFK